MNALLFCCTGDDIQRREIQIIKCLLACIITFRNLDSSHHLCRIRAAAKSTNTHAGKISATCCEPGSQKQCTGACRYHRNISINCPSCSAGRSLTYPFHLQRVLLMQPDDRKRRGAFAAQPHIPVNVWRIFRKAV